MSEVYLVEENKKIQVRSVLTRPIQTWPFHEFLFIRTRFEQYGQTRERRQSFTHWYLFLGTLHSLGAGSDQDEGPFNLMLPLRLVLFCCLLPANDVEKIPAKTKRNPLKTSSHRLKSGGREGRMRSQCTAIVILTEWEPKGMLNRMVPDVPNRRYSGSLSLCD